MRKMGGVIALATFFAVFPHAAIAGDGNDRNSAIISARSRGDGPLHKVWHYVSTHKELLAVDAIIIAGWSADAASTVHDEHACPSCIETNSVLGPHPSERAIWLYASGWSALQTTLNHLAWHYAPDPVLRHIVWIPAIVTTTNELYNVRNNVRAAGVTSPSTLSIPPRENEMLTPRFRKLRIR